MHPQTLRKYEREGLIAPSRTTGNLRLYSDEDLDRLRQVKYLVNERGLNLAGVQLILELTRHMQAVQAKLAGEAVAEENVTLERASEDLAALLHVLGASSRRPGEQGRSNGTKS
jgi:MerR family transcriptional regulator/heat shock protein HspR